MELNGQKNVIFYSETDFQIYFRCESEDPEFRADHPFIYFIQNTEDNATIFSGRIKKIIK